MRDISMDQVIEERIDSTHLLFSVDIPHTNNPPLIYIDSQFIFVYNRRTITSSRSAAGDPILVDDVLPSGIRIIRSMKNDVRIYPDGRAIWNNQRLQQLDPDDYIIAVRAIVSIAPKPKKKHHDKS